MLDEGLFQLTLINKDNGEKQFVEAKSYSLTIHDAYKIMKKELNNDNNERTKSTALAIR